MKQQLVVILDREDGRSRLFTLDESGFQESSLGDMDGLAGEVKAKQPDLILVNPDAVSLSGETFARELNRLLRFRSGYAWDPGHEAQAAE